MGDLGLEVRGQVNDVDGVEGAFLRADTTSDTQSLGDEGDLGGPVDFDAQLSCPYDRAGLLAFLSAFLVCVRRGKAQKRVALALGLHCHSEHSHVSDGQILSVEG